VLLSIIILCNYCHYSYPWLFVLQNFVPTKQYLDLISCHPSFNQHCIFFLHKFESRCIIEVESHSYFVTGFFPCSIMSSGFIYAVSCAKFLSFLRLNYIPSCDYTKLYWFIHLLMGLLGCFPTQINMGIKISD
jgi:hypothetical protein